MVDKKIILNNCFKTKKASFTNIEKTLRDLKPEKANSANNDIIEFSVDDPQLLLGTPGAPTQLAYYNYLEEIDPTNNYYDQEGLGGKWERRGGNPARCRNFGHSLLNNGLHITNVPTGVSGNNVSWDGGSAIHYNRDLTSKTIRLISSVDRCVADITLAVPREIILRNTPFNFSAPVDVHRTDELKFSYWENQGVSLGNNPVLSQRNFVTIGADDGKLNMRFLLRFDNIIEDLSDVEIVQESGGSPKKIGENGKPGVYLLDIENEGYNNFYSSINFRYPVPEFDADDNIIGIWSGDTPKKFKFIIERNNEDIMTGLVYVESPSGKLVLINKDKDGNPVYIDASSVSAVNNAATEFGQYSWNHIANINVQKVDFKAYSKANYNFTLKNKDENKSFTGNIGVDGDLSNTGPQKLINYFIERYTYNIGLYNNTYSYATWFFNATKDGNQAIIDDNVYVVKPDKNRFTVFNHTDYNAIQKKDKCITVTADKNSIKSFINPARYIYDINVRGLVALEELDLSGNLLTSLDLTDNINIKNINLSGNTGLKALYLPYFTGSNSSSTALELNLTETNLDFIQLIYDKATTSGLNPPLYYVKLKLVEDSSVRTELPNIKKMDIQRIAFTTYDDIYSPNVIFPNIKEINISETNILTDRNNLLSFIGKLPDRTGEEPGVIYMYGKKYTYNGKQGSAKAIASELETLKNKNWLFYL